MKEGSGLQRTPFGYSFTTKVDGRSVEVEVTVEAVRAIAGGRDPDQVAADYQPEFETIAAEQYKSTNQAVITLTILDLSHLVGGG